MAEGSILTLQLARLLASGAFSVSGGTNTAAQAIADMAGGQLAALQAQEAEDKRQKQALPSKIIGGISGAVGGFGAGGPIGAVAGGLSGFTGESKAAVTPLAEAPKSNQLEFGSLFGSPSVGSRLSSINTSGELKLSDFFNRNRLR